MVRPPELVGGYLNVVPPNRLFCDVTHFGQLIEAALQHECVVIVAGRRGLPTYAKLAYAELIPQMINQPMYETFSMHQLVLATSRAPLFVIDLL